MNAPTFRERLRYRFENRLATGTASLVGLLGTSAAILVVAVGVFLWLAHVSVDGHVATGIEGVWLSLLRALDPGTMGSDSGWAFRLASLTVSIGGILFGSILIGLVASGLDRRMHEMRQGRSAVLESRHLLILGWSHRVFLLLRELNAAQEGSSRLCVVILADKDKPAMEDELDTSLDRLPNLRIVIRSGVPGDQHALRRVGPQRARSIVILSDGFSSDAQVVHLVLALEAIGLPTDIPIVMEFADARSAASLELVSGLKTHVVVPHEIISKITARVVLNPALAKVYEGLLDFAGCEIYLHEVRHGQLGCTLFDVAGCVDKAAIFGIVRGETVLLAPAVDTVLQHGDRLVLLAETISSGVFDMATLPKGVDRQVRLDLTALEQPSIVALLGWSSLAPRVLHELNQLVMDRLTVEIITDDETGVVAEQYENLDVLSLRGDTTNPDVIRRVTANRAIDRVVVLAGRTAATTQEADARVLLSVLELRLELGSRSEVHVVAELLDPRNVELLRDGHREEFIVGDRLACLLMAQLGDNPDRGLVFHELLRVDGPEIAVVPTMAVLPEGTSCCFGELARELLTSGCYLIGYRSAGIVSLAPSRDELIRSNDNEQLIVVVPNVKPNQQSHS